ncbi:SPFH domain-containing protein [Burkholderia sp. WTPI3]|uniref:SPFH domain-containing protein n=1 Tax=Burkholderia sp. WTPI3 TaxID=2822167 RepID=UPI001EFF3192|nr:SPFH domain-containing protein [Burkholderia sp. WTPI3]
MSAQPAPPLGPGAQAVRLSFWFIAALAVLAACAWASSNIRRIPADSRAVVMRFGALVRTQDAGLVIAWPRPFESVRLVPGAARVLEQKIRSLDRDPRALASSAAGVARLPDALAGSGYVLTGDGGAVALSAVLYYRVSDPYAYVLQQDRLDAALERIVSASAVEVAAARDLDAILVARPEQIAERTIAEARTAAEQRRQDAQQDADRIVQEAQARATERVATAQTDTLEIRQLDATLRENGDPGLLARLYRDRVQRVLAKAGRVTTIDPRDTSNLILPGNAR